MVDEMKLEIFKKNNGKWKMEILRIFEWILKQILFEKI